MGAATLAGVPGARPPGRARARAKRRVLPGFGLTLGYTLF